MAHYGFAQPYTEAAEGHHGHDGYEAYEGFDPSSVSSALAIGELSRSTSISSVEETSPALQVASQLDSTPYFSELLPLPAGDNVSPSTFDLHAHHSTSSTYAAAPGTKYTHIPAPVYGAAFGVLPQAQFFDGTYNPFLPANFGLTFATYPIPNTSAPTAAPAYSPRFTWPAYLPQTSFPATAHTINDHACVATADVFGSLPLPHEPPAQPCHKRNYLHLPPESAISTTTTSSASSASPILKPLSSAVVLALNAPQPQAHEPAVFSSPVVPDEAHEDEDVDMDRESSDEHLNPPTTKKSVGHKATSKTNAHGEEKKKRTRIPQACEACKFRKHRCFDGRPCNRCSRMGLTCIFSTAPRQRGPNRSGGGAEQSPVLLSSPEIASSISPLVKKPRRQSHTATMRATPASLSAPLPGSDGLILTTPVTPLKGRKRKAVTGETYQPRHRRTKSTHKADCSDVHQSVAHSISPVMGMDTQLNLASPTVDATIGSTTLPQLQYFGSTSHLASSATWVSKTPSQPSRPFAPSLPLEGNALGLSAPAHGSNMSAWDPHAPAPAHALVPTAAPASSPETIGLGLGLGVGLDTFPSSHIYRATSTVSYVHDTGITWTPTRTQSADEVDGADLFPPDHYDSNIELCTPLPVPMSTSTTSTSSTAESTNGTAKIHPPASHSRSPSVNQSVSATPRRSVLMPYDVNGTLPDDVWATFEALNRFTQGQGQSQGQSGAYPTPVTPYSALQTPFKPSPSFVIDTLAGGEWSA